MREADSEDFVTWALRAIVDAFPGIPSNSIIAIERRVRRRWGGTRQYGAKKGPSESRQGAPREGQD